ncbi:MAG: CehA/McbA family metallohydrolase, partial [Proteobacteria bacterium]|nr:CehA/McbA family metallohydrolase [Pseudomonadota bacterium]
VRLDSLAAAGLDVAVLTDRNMLNTQLISAPSAGTLLLPGTEIQLTGEGKDRPFIGHMSVFPIDPASDVNHRPSESIASSIDTWRGLTPYKNAGDLVLQLNHPRGVQLAPSKKLLPTQHGLFAIVRYNQQEPVGEGANTWMTRAEEGTKTTALDFDAIEVVNRFSLAGYKNVRRDWYDLLAQNYGITGTGNSDSRSLNVEQAGFPINLVDCKKDPFDPAAFVAAVKGQHLSVTTGPVVSLEVISGEEKATPGNTLKGKSTVKAKVRVEAAPWIPVHMVRLVVNGKVVKRHTAEKPLMDDVLRADLTWDVELEGDSFIVAEAGWPLDKKVKGVGKPYQQVAPGYVPLGFTNPVLVDVDGDGTWTPPGHILPPAKNPATKKEGPPKKDGPQKRDGPAKK